MMECICEAEISRYWLKITYLNWSYNKLALYLTEKFERHVMYRKPQSCHIDDDYIDCHIYEWFVNYNACAAQMRECFAYAPPKRKLFTMYHCGVPRCLVAGYVDYRNPES